MMAASTDAVDGEAKTLPHTAADSIPSATQGTACDVLEARPRGSR